MVQSTAPYAKADVIFITERQQTFHLKFWWSIYIVLGVLLIGKVTLSKDNTNNFKKLLKTLLNIL